ncbi:MAG: MerR family transcriptional regulator [Clostridia bacterium]|nr:MerR family transcriptional regulator [Clostridia bacterium]
MQTGEFAKLASVSVRTLHYYDEIGLLKPAFVDEQNGYRFYDETSLERMQEILFYRELDFKLKSIAEILSSPDYDKQKALAEQRKLLILKKERLERIIDALDGAEKGKITMSAFDNSDYETARTQYEIEAKRRWGETTAYKEYEQKSINQSVNDGLMTVLAKFAECMKDGHAAASEEAQALVKELQNYISDNYYNCTDEILAGLGQMYVADVRFKNNIDQHTSGTAAFISEAIAAYCKK